MSRIKKIIASLLRILAGVPIVCLLIGGLLFLILGATLKGRSVGLSVVILGGLLYCSVGYWNRDWFRRRRKRLYAILLPVSTLLFLIPAFFAPDGGQPEGHVRNCFLHGQRTFSRFSPWNVIPEKDQLSVGMHLMPLGDPYVNLAKAARMRSLILPMYDEMARDADFHSVGSVMGMAYRELFRLPYRTGHYSVFLPHAAPGERLPCLIFLHGMGGNPRACLWVLSRLAKQKKVIVISPTYGMGNWDKPDSGPFVVDVAREAIEKFPIDPDRIFLLGYSNGAMGVTRAAIHEPSLFKGLIYLSAVTEDNIFSRTRFAKRLDDRKVLFLHGGCDERIPAAAAEGTVMILKQRGFDARVRIYKDEDHSLLFSQSESVLDEIAQCMAVE